MQYVKSIFALWSGCFMLQACGNNEGNSMLVGKWQYERMERKDLQNSTDTLQVALMEGVYRGSVLQFYTDGTFVMSKRDSVTNFAGKGTYEMDARKKVLTMEGNVRNSDLNRMSVQVFQLSADSLKIGSAEEVFIYSRAIE